MSAKHAQSDSVEKLTTTHTEASWAVRLRCPACECRIPNIGVGPETVQLTCPGCGFVIHEVNGIVRALRPESKLHFERFVRDYEVVRAKEGWGSETPDYYLALPFKDLTNRHNWIWKIRAQTLRYMQKHVMGNMERTQFPDCRVLDIGAGNGWLSYRLSQSGYRPTAVDLLDNDVDGLGAARHYLARLPRSFPRFQAEMDYLPFDSGQYDVAIFNASFHYSSDYEKTLGEALRCLRRPGIVVIADTPFYRREESGKQMLEERRAAFERQFGVRSDNGQSREYLTQPILSELERRLAIRWNVGKPWYGMSWAFRPVRARLLRRREPSKFYVFWFKVG